MIQDHSNFEHIQINWPFNLIWLVMNLRFDQSERLLDILAALNRLSKVTEELLSTTLLKTSGQSTKCDWLLFCAKLIFLEQLFFELVLGALLCHLTSFIVLPVHI